MTKQIVTVIIDQ